ncbi:MAG: stress response translation initiation inhibitor YciH [Candidatus Methanofastidiosia archaeon]
MSEICQVCGLPKELCVCEEIAMEEQQIRIYTTRRRYRKLMTIVEGISKDIDIKELAVLLKKRCATGGTAKNDRIELQGDQKEKVKKILMEKGLSEEMIDVR